MRPREDAGSSRPHGVGQVDVHDVTTSIAPANRESPPSPGVQAEPELRGHPSGSERQAHLEGRAVAHFAVETDAATVCLDDRLHEGQSEPKAPLASALVTPVEPFPHARAILGRDPAARVEHADHGTRLFTDDRHFDPAPEAVYFTALSMRFAHACRIRARSTTTSTPGERRVTMWTPRSDETMS